MQGWLRERSHAFAHTVSLYVKPYGESALSKPQRFLWTLPQASGRRTSTTAWGSAPAFAHRAWPRSRRDHPRRRRRRRRHRNSRGRGIPGRRLRSLLGTPGSQPSRCDPASRAKERPAWTADDLSGVDQAGRRGRLLAFCQSLGRSTSTSGGQSRAGSRLGAPGLRSAGRPAGEPAHHQPHRACLSGDPSATPTNRRHVGPTFGGPQFLSAG